MMICDRRSKDEIKRGFSSITNMDLNDMPVKKKGSSLTSLSKKWNCLMTGKSTDGNRS